MYDKFSDDYDRFVNWENRLSAEMPFLVEKINHSFPNKINPIRILDAATGTGMHAIALAKHGYDVAGADISEGMILRAIENRRNAASNIRFLTAGFGSLAESFDFEPNDTGTLVKESLFDVVLCLGNSLPHVTSVAELNTALIDFANCLSPGGLLVLQNRNFNSVIADKERWMEPQSHQEKNREWVFLRFYDYLPDGLINFNIVTLSREKSGGWSQSVSETRLMPLLAEDLQSHLRGAGFEEINLFGGLDGSKFQSTSSGNLVVTARKK